jgi:hypothetical protein
MRQMTPGEFLRWELESARDHLGQVERGLYDQQDRVRRAKQRVEMLEMLLATVDSAPPTPPPAASPPDSAPSGPASRSPDWERDMTEREWSLVKQERGWPPDLTRERASEIQGSGIEFLAQVDRTLAEIRNSEGRRP